MEVKKFMQASIMTLIQTMGRVRHERQAGNIYFLVVVYIDIIQCRWQMADF